MAEDWFEDDYRRIETIFQISDRDASFRTRFDAAEYIVSVPRHKRRFFRMPKV
jgi:hypothetical protein